MFEDDETVMIGNQNEEFLMDEEDMVLTKEIEANEKEEDNAVEPQAGTSGVNNSSVSSPKRSAKGKKNTVHHCEGSDEENEVLFGKNKNVSNATMASNGQSKQRLSLSDFADKCNIKRKSEQEQEAEKEAEEASMRKFAIFWRRMDTLLKPRKVGNLTRVRLVQVS